MRRLISVSLLLFTGYFSFSHGQAVTISNDIEELKLEKYAQVFITENEQLLLSEIHQSQWEKSEKGTHFGMVNKTHWIKYDFTNPSVDSIELVFYIPYHHIRKIDFFFSNSQDTAKIREYGTTRYYYKKERIIFCKRLQLHGRTNERLGGIQIYRYSVQ